MRLSSSTIAVAAALIALVVASGPQAVGTAHAACAPEDRIDGSTADQAKAKMEAEGYRAVSDLKKGCDNYWHAKAVKDGAQVGIVLSPQGLVRTEGD